MDKWIVLVSSILVSSILLMIYPHSVLAANTAINVTSLAGEEGGLVMLNLKILDACLPFSYHIHDTASLVINQTKISPSLCADLLVRVKQYCEDTMTRTSIVCSDPRYTDFLVHDFGTPTFQQAQSSNSSKTP